MDENLRKVDGWALRGLGKMKRSFTSNDGAPVAIGSEEAVKGLSLKERNSEMRKREMRWVRDVILG